jgi:L-amino acid N-acyltransferase YncA
MCRSLLLSDKYVNPYLLERPEVLISIKSLNSAHWESVRTIYLEGIATGLATFETEAPTWEEWDARHLPFARLIATAEADEALLGWAALSPVSIRRVYFGVAEVSVYVAANVRGQGVGRVLLQGLVDESEANGIWSLQASIFPENLASLRVHESCGFRVVGVRERIAKLNGLWRDTVILERRSKLTGNG